MQAALRALNQLVADHVIDCYAIGGAIGASSGILERHKLTARLARAKSMIEEH